jgi:hypothetical protein
MTTSSRERNLPQHPPTAGGWRTRDVSGKRPVDAWSELRDAASGLERVPCAAWALEPDRLQQLRRPLYFVDQGLRFGAGACELGRELVASIQGHR